MEERGNELLPLATKIAREFDNIPRAKQAAHKLAGAAITSLRERLEAMGFHGVDTLGFLKSIQKSGCGVPPQTVPGGVTPPIFSRNPTPVDDFTPHP
jgi:hypothetical protein